MGVAKPALHHVQRNALADSGHAQRVAQPFGLAWAPSTPATASTSLTRRHAVERDQDHSGSRFHNEHTILFAQPGLTTRMSVQSTVT